MSEREIDLLWGAKPIADAIGTNTRKAFYLLETGKIPARKVGKCWVAERAELRAFFLTANKADPMVA